MIKHYTALTLLGIGFGVVGTTMIDHSFGNDESFSPSSKGMDVSQTLISSSVFTGYDFWSDESITKFIGKEFDFNDLDYIPQDLVRIDNIKTISAPPGAALRKEAAEELKKLAQAFWNRFQIPLIIVSAYRSYQYQEDLFDTYKKRMGTGKSEAMSAKPGYSEHQAGLAIDIFSPSTETEFFDREDYKVYYQRFRNNAHKYGFHQSYQRGKTIDGYMKEPRHWRYVGVDLATYLYKNRLTFTEFFSQQLFTTGHYSLLSSQSGTTQKF